MKKRNDFIDCLGHAYKDALKPGKHETAKYLLGVFEQIGVLRTDGGPGSGNFGHEGSPGEIGGSAPSDGTAESSGEPWKKYGATHADRREKNDEVIQKCRLKKDHNWRTR